MVDATPQLAWRWQPALFAAVCAVPAAIVTSDDVSRGLAHLPSASFRRPRSACHHLAPSG
jgi:hypothetical protein